MCLLTVILTNKYVAVAVMLALVCIAMKTRFFEAKF